MLSTEDRYALLCIWSSLVTFVSVFYLTERFWPSLLIGLFVFVSCSLGFGARWLMRGSFAAGVLAIAVLLGFPKPETWSAHLKSAQEQIGAKWRTSFY